MTNDTKPVLFLYNKFFQGQKDQGPTSNWEVTWKVSLESFFGENLHTFNPDTYGPSSSSQSDAALLDLIGTLSPKLIIMIYHNGLDWNREFVSIDTMRKIQLVSKIVCIWGDIHILDQRILIRKLSKIVDLNLCTASSAAMNRLKMGYRVRYVPVPVLETKITDFCHCGRKISFAGRIKDKRKNVINFLEKDNINIHLGGGEGSKALTRTEFLQILGHEMTISFSGSKLESLTNARTFEALSQRTLLLEQWGTETCKFLEPYVDYVPWFSKRDLLRKIHYYQIHTGKAIRIRENGYSKFKEFSNEKLWTSVVAKVLEPYQSAQEVRLKMNLGKIPILRRLQAIFYDFCASNSSFEILFVILFHLKRRVRIFRSYSIRAMTKTKKYFFDNLISRHD